MDANANDKTNDNVSFTDNGDPTAAGAKNGGSSAMLDLLGDLNRKDTKQDKKKKGKKEKKEKKSKTKKVRKADRYESQNFLYRIEGSIFCGGIIVGVIALITYIVGGVIFGVITNGHLVSYMMPLWGTVDSGTDQSSQ